MDGLFLEPLKYYENSAKERHSRNVADFFDKLLNESAVDVAANRATAKAYRHEQKIVEGLEGKIKLCKVLRIILIILSVCAAITALFGLFGEGISGTARTLTVAIGAAVAIASIIIIFLVINPRIKHSSELLKKHKEKASELLNTAYAQVAPLNALFDDTHTFELIEKTTPEISFDTSYDKRQELSLRSEYGFEDGMDGGCSVVDILSGKLKDNPFVYYRYLRRYMGTKNYTGSLRISWTEHYRDSKGNLQTRHRSQVLTATVTKPKPYYEVKTSLGYGCAAASDLTFSRAPGHVERLSEKALERKIRSGERKLQSKGRKLSGNFREMSNSEFDVIFGATNRDHEVQFRVMYTPLGQENTVSLLRSKSGYGDDFHFIKNKKHNIIISEHSQAWEMDTSAKQYRSYDVDIIKQKFNDFNNEYYRSVFFDFAPLMAVPAYQEDTTDYDPPAPGEANYTRYEHEALSNAIGRAVFAHPETHQPTEVVLKVGEPCSIGDVDVVMVTASSFRTEQRCDFVSVFGGDGRMHAVPVPWIEYIPIERRSFMAMKAVGLSEREFAVRYGGQLSTLDTCAYTHGLLAFAMPEGMSFDSAAGLLKKYI